MNPPTGETTTRLAQIPVTPGTDSRFDTPALFAHHRQFRDSQTNFSLDELLSGGRCQWVLDTVRQTGEWPNQPLRLDSAALRVPLTIVLLTLGHIRGTIRGTDRVHIDWLKTKPRSDYPGLLLLFH